MSEKEIAPTIAATMVEAKGMTDLHRTYFNYQNTTEDRERQRGFVETLLISKNARGSSNAIRTDQLVKLAGLSDKRSLQAQIEKERAAGALILSKCTSGGGYYMPESRAEIVSYVRTLKGRAFGTLRTLKSARRVLREIDGQFRFELTDGKDGGECAEA